MDKEEELLTTGMEEEILDAEDELISVDVDELDLERMSEVLRKEVRTASGQKKISAIRRLEVVEAFRKSGNLKDILSE